MMDLHNCATTYELELKETNLEELSTADKLALGQQIKNWWDDAILMDEDFVIEALLQIIQSMAVDLEQKEAALAWQRRKVFIEGISVDDGYRTFPDYSRYIGRYVYVRGEQVKDRMGNILGNLGPVVKRSYGAT